MRGVVLILAAALLAAFVVLGLKDVQGYVLLVLPPYRVQLSWALFVVGGVALLALGVALAWFLGRLITLPRRWRRWRAKRRMERTLAALEQAVAAYLLGKPRQGEQAFRRLARLDAGSVQAAAAALLCKAALEAGDEARAENALAALRAARGQWQGAFALLATAFGLKFKRSDWLTAGVAGLEKAAPALAPSVRQKYLLEIAVAEGHWHEVLERVRTLYRHELLAAEDMGKLLAQAYPHLIRDLIERGQNFAAWWAKQPREERLMPAVVAAAVQTLGELGARTDALNVAEALLRHHYYPEVLRALLPVLPADQVWLARLEAWQKELPHDGDILEALVRVALRQRLLGKAKAYWEMLQAVDSLRARAVAGEFWLLMGESAWMLQERANPTWSSSPPLPPAAHA